MGPKGFALTNFAAFPVPAEFCSDGILSVYALVYSLLASSEQVVCQRYLKLRFFQHSSSSAALLSPRESPSISYFLRTFYVFLLTKLRYVVRTDRTARRAEGPPVRSAASNT